ncbi:MAG: type II 3-dehydroquinate dehydratase [Eubacteriales bacterium]|jgi:3-dehydroquinate dehydratase-2|nr:type II 3-dehydroquinate dehydratase [Eubacteriales bacterium]MDD4326852.1 type II 3-dehydroquinate dehydratase [Eubacteriales bacterium]MDD4716614.1 type II 3-dehydroquinate dehydratase [Eubacteriales bacterium]
MKTGFAEMTETEISFKAFGDLKLTLLLINGPNLNMLGKRDPKQYGTFTLADVEKTCSDKALSRGYELITYQSNHEGDIIDRIHSAMIECDGIVINPGALTHYSYAIRDAIELCGLPVVEVHISDISSREGFRRISVVEDVCISQVKGFGIDSYTKGIDILCDTIERQIDRR